MKYQITLVVDVEANDDDHAAVLADGLGEFLGMHYQTTSLGCVTEVTWVDEELEEEMDITEDDVSEEETVELTDFYQNNVHFA